jgi:hypothetical protein
LINEARETLHERIGISDVTIQIERSKGIADWPQAASRSIWSQSEIDPPKAAQIVKSLSHDGGFQRDLRQAEFVTTVEFRTLPAVIPLFDINLDRAICAGDHHASQTFEKNRKNLSWAFLVVVEM